MATDKSEPRVGLIIKVGVIAVCTVGAVRIALASYFDQVTQTEQARKIAAAKPEALMNLRTDEHTRLTSGRKPIGQAMEELAKKGRMGASPAIVPTVSHDVAPLQGWTKLPGTVPPSMTSPEPAAHAPDTASAADAGAANAPALQKASDAGPGKR
ncbi:MAG: hypothetical protein FWD17_01220 [Polyangiaceae bacterium]|nr:hypothetical protein [Polyangiaceae bacterium]